MSQKRFFDFQWRYFEPTAIYDFLESTRQKQVASFVKVNQVACAIPAADEGMCGRFRIAFIALENCWPLDNNLSDFSDCEKVTFAIHSSQVYSVVGGSN